MRTALFIAVVAVASALVAVRAQERLTIEPLKVAGPVNYFIAEGEKGSSYRPSDRELAKWALAAWERSAGGALHFEPGSESASLVRVYWVPAGGGQYGEMRGLMVDGRRGAAVFIRPDTDGLGPDISRLARQDPLVRETIVYLTCLHELGHALGLTHTSNFQDIMYFFGFGGDIPGFFTRYRSQLTNRADIAKVTGLSANDISRVTAFYK